jgi:hypothetical protein
MNKLTNQTPEKKKQWVTPAIVIISVNQVQKNRYNNMEVHNGKSTQITINGIPETGQTYLYKSVHS